jgi:hypothetical protein
VRSLFNQTEENWRTREFDPGNREGLLSIADAPKRLTQTKKVFWLSVANAAIVSGATLAEAKAIATEAVDNLTWSDTTNDSDLIPET